MDFSQVKSITIPEGTVTKITSGSVTLWEKPAEKSWHVLSSTTYNQWVYTGGGNGWTTKTKFPTVPSQTEKLRITWKPDVTWHSSGSSSIGTTNYLYFMGSNSSSAAVTKS